MPASSGMLASTGRDPLALGADGWVTVRRSAIAAGADSSCPVAVALPSAAGADNRREFGSSNLPLWAVRSAERAVPKSKAPVSSRTAKPPETRLSAARASVPKESSPEATEGGGDGSPGGADSGGGEGGVGGADSGGGEGRVAGAGSCGRGSESSWSGPARSISCRSWPVSAGWLRSRQAGACRRSCSGANGFDWGAGTVGLVCSLNDSARLVGAGTATSGKVRVGRGLASYGSRPESLGFARAAFGCARVGSTRGRDWSVVRSGVPATRWLTGQGVAGGGSAGGGGETDLTSGGIATLPGAAGGSARNSGECGSLVGSEPGW